MRSLVASEQLTFSNGGFTMFDEAGPSYVDMLDQTTLGIRFILSEFGPSGKSTFKRKSTSVTQGYSPNDRMAPPPSNIAALPAVNYQLDPFGHSVFEGRCEL